MENPKLFDCHDNGDYAIYGTDITLRDIYAGLAMHALMQEALSEDQDPDHIASMSRRQADAMLAARAEES